MEAYIQDNPYLVYDLVAVFAALVHWWVMVQRGQATADFVTYWFKETPGYSLGTVGALALACWLVYTSKGLGGIIGPDGVKSAIMPTHMLIEGAFMTGFGINALVDQGAQKTAGGFARTSLLLVLAVLAALVMLAGCAITQEAKLKQGYDTASASVRTTTVLVRRDAITVPQAERAEQLARIGKQTLDDGAQRLRICRALQVTKPETKCDDATANINLGSGVLMELEKFLKDREAAK